MKRLLWAVLGLCLMMAAGCAVPSPQTEASPTAPPSDTVEGARQHVTGRVPAPGACHYRTAADGQLLPDATCTPGATDPGVTQAEIAATICVRGYTTGVRPSVSETDHAKHGLMLAYAITQPNELDHLISLELGGSSDTANLWPEPPPSPNPKDKVENDLHDLVCARVWHPGEAYLPLAVAQHLIATDWTTALQKAKANLAP